jgi:cyclic 2,3-diphosphoglycerate synthetase
MRVIALIDGEHHPAVARDALARVAAEHDLRGVVFVGGEEKVARSVLEDPVAHYGHEVTIAAADPAAALRELSARGADAVLDLSGEPVLGGDERMRLVCVALALELEYRCAGYRVTPPPRERLDAACPVIAVIGTGKRTGKTALAGHFALLLRARGTEPVIVAMGRGGPPRPQLVRADERPDAARLLEIARAGEHAASDYLEDAVVAGVSCVGCRRCGEGPAGEVFDSNVAEGTRLALSLDPDVVLLEGSGAALPPVEADRSVCITSAQRADLEALSHLGPYRLLRSDLLVVIGAETLDGGALGELKRRLADWIAPDAIVACALAAEPLGDVPSGSRVAFFSTSEAHEGPLRERLEQTGVDVCVTSANLARRGLLEADLELAARKGCDIYLTELKAAAIELVAERAERVGARIEFVRNRPLSLPGEPDLDERLELLHEEALVAAGAGAPAAGRAR